MDTIRSIGVIGGITLLVTAVTLAVPSHAASVILDLVNR